MVDDWSVRIRRKDDLPPLVRVLRSVHERDGYPGRWPEDPERWLTPDGLVGAWVVGASEAPVGHVALTAVDAGRPTAVAWAAAVGDGLPLRCVTRLFVAADARGAGAGTALLDAAVAGAQAAGARAVLEVAGSDVDALALYRRLEWQEAGRVAGDPAAGPPSLLFVAPDGIG